MTECSECGSKKVKFGFDTGIQCLKCGNQISPPLSEIEEKQEQEEVLE